MSKRNGSRENAQSSTHFDKDIVDAYETGKHRRYALLFSVNGGAFAVAKLLLEESSKSSAYILGNLKIEQLAIGLAVFTLVMAWDIWEFGQKMKKHNAELFKWQGKSVLALLALLLAIGWGLVAYGPGKNEPRAATAEGKVPWVCGNLGMICHDNGPAIALQRTLNVAPLPGTSNREFRLC